MTAASTAIDSLDWDARPTPAEIESDPAGSLGVAEAYLAQIARSLNETLDELYDGHGRGW